MESALVPLAGDGAMELRQMPCKDRSAFQLSQKAAAAAHIPDSSHQPDLRVGRDHPITRASSPELRESPRQNQHLRR